MKKKKHPEYKILADLLETASDEFSNHGCNDYELDDTPENRDLLEAAHWWNVNNDRSQPFEIVVYKGKLITSDYFLMDYFSHLFDELAKESVAE